MTVAVVVPVRSFRRAKTRLRTALAAAAREQLVRDLAARVLDAAKPLPTFVITPDDDVAAWAKARGASILVDTARELNAAVASAQRSLCGLGYERMIVAHADLPLADDLTWLGDARGVVVVPDQRDDGTPVLAVPTAVGFRFAYGAASSYHHAAEAARLGLEATVARDPLLGWDVDLPGDLDLPDGAALAARRRASRRLRADAPWTSLDGIQGDLAADAAAEQGALSIAPETRTMLDTISNEVSSAH